MKSTPFLLASLLALFFFAFESVSGSLIPPNTSQGPDYRLPTSFIPRSYHVTLRSIIDRDHPDIGEKNTAPGRVLIKLDCLEDTDQIVLHSSGSSLQINESSILVGVHFGGTRAVVSVEYDEERDFLTINLETGIKEGDGVDLTIDFVAKIHENDSQGGLYTEKYLDPLTNEMKVVAVTQLQTTKARQVFPCFDEPHLKASFIVEIGRTSEFTTLANGFFQETKADPDHPEWFIDYYYETLPISTYLFAIAVSQYEANSADPNLYRIPVAVHGPKHLADAGQFQLAANSTSRLLANFEERFEALYGNSKMDSVAVPHKNFAMENYGLVTYPLSSLVFKEGITTSLGLRNMYINLAHELAHQWFGNDVTCKWWSDIWLNEGFANYFTTLGFQDLWPEFNISTSYVYDIVDALRVDAGSNSHPLHQDVWTPQEIDSHMDSISYDKGAAMLSMLVEILDETAFYNGTIGYLERFKNGVAEQADFFQSLDEAAQSHELELPKSVSEIMQRWTLQKGFPLLRVQAGSARNTFQVSQEAFRNDGDNSDPKETSWDVHVTYGAPINDHTEEYGEGWLLSEKTSMDIQVTNSDGWFLLNPKGAGYYRTLYEPAIGQK